MKGFPARAVIFAALALSSTVPAFAEGLNFTCDASIDAAAAGTCAYLNSTIKGLYSSTFTNANADIFIKQTGGGLGQSTQVGSQTLSFSAYRNLLNSNPSKNALQISAVAALDAMAVPIYGSGNVG